MSDSNEDLDAIKRLVEGKSRHDILAVREDIAGHIRSLDPLLSPWPDPDKNPQMTGEAQRLARHQRELAYLDELLA